MLNFLLTKTDNYSIMCLMSKNIKGDDVMLYSIGKSDENVKSI